MATIQKSISTRVNGQGLSEVLMRISVSMNAKFRIKSGIFIDSSRFKDGRIVYPRANQKEVARLREIDSQLQELESLILDFVMSHKADMITKEMLLEIVDRYHHPEIYEAKEAPRQFFELWDEFLYNRDLSKSRHDCYQSLGRTLHRYEAHRRATKESDYSLDVDSFNADDVTDFERFLRNEWQYYDEYPQIYIDYPAELRIRRKTHKPQKRGDNYAVSTLKKLRAFFNWCRLQDLTANRPFEKYAGNKSERYGTPYYLTIEERDRIADFDLSARPQLAIQRDIFIFQCLTGPRVSDLTKLKQSNVVGDMVEYIPQKTKKERSEIVRVPLCERAQKIIEKYTDPTGDKLLPFISDQRYNDAIKDICRICGIERMVTIINPTTGKDERRHIYEVASSHMARRTFIGNLYKQVKDPNLVGALSGHKEGSRAFTRYREIDDDIKRGLIDLIK